jgi:hypothetical protein
VSAVDRLAAATPACRKRRLEKVPKIMIRRFLQIFPPKWDTLRLLGQSRIVSLTTLTPFIGYLIIFNHYLVEYLRLSSDILSHFGGNTDATSTSMSRLVQLYIGLVLIGIASIFFKACCPRIISRHRDLYDYVESELKVINTDRFRSIQARFHDLHRWGRSKWATKLNSGRAITLKENRTTLSETLPLVWEGWINENRLALTTALATSYELENDAREIARWFIALCYVSGFSFLAWPSLIIFTRVLYYLIESR